jgi:PAS domain-containing protein
MSSRGSSMPADPPGPAGRTAERAGSNAALQAAIADRTRAEEELRWANQAFQALIRASPLAIIALDARGRVTLRKPAAERSLGWREEEILGRPLPSIPTRINFRLKSAEGVAQLHTAQ